MERDDLPDFLRDAPSQRAFPIVVLTGSGISAESGLATFRDADGLWQRYRIEEVATPEAFAANPTLVHDFYNQRRRQLRDSAIAPNAAHLALAKLEREWPGSVTIITQNVDNLHERAGSRNLIHMHGELQKARCQRCGQVHYWEQDLDEHRPCPACGAKKALRPHVVWFGEQVFALDSIQMLLRDCGLFLVIGTAGAVYPAAGFVAEVLAMRRAQTVEINLAETDISQYFHENIYGKAGDIVPKVVEQILTWA